MKIQLLFPLLAAGAMIFLTGCPVAVDYPLGYPGMEKIDKDLVGHWFCNDTAAEVLEVNVKKMDDFSYSVNVIRSGDMYSLSSDELKGWVTELDGKKFFYTQSNDPSEAGYYLYCYSVKTDVLTTYDVSLKIAGVDGVTSTEAYRKEVSESLKFQDCLVEEKTWVKK